MSDDDLLNEIRAGNSNALQTLYTRYRDKFIKVLIKNHSCNMKQATETYQTVILLVYENIMEEKLTTVNNENSLWNYVYVTGVNKNIARLRQQKKMAGMPDEFLVGIPDEEEAFDERSFEEDLQVEHLKGMQDALDSLGEPCTKILELFYFENKSMTDIAEQLNYNNRDTAKNQKYKCLQRLRQAFSKTSKKNQ